MNARDLLGPADLPAGGARLPGVVVRLALALAGTLLTLDVFSAGGFIGLGILLSLIAALEPSYLLGWLLIVYLAGGEISHSAALHWQLLALLAGVHLIHVLSMLALELPWRGWVQPSALRAPLLRYLAIQIPSQLVAVLVLVLLAPKPHGHRPVTVVEFGVIGALALGALGLVFLRQVGDDLEPAPEPEPERR